MSFSGLMVMVATLSVCLCSPPGNSSDVSLHQSEQDLSPVPLNITRSRRQTVKSLPRLRRPRQILAGGAQGGGFVHLGPGPTFLPPPTLPPSGQPSQMIQATRSKLLDSVKVDLQSDTFGHQHRIEDGRGNFQFFQIGKRKEKTANILNTNFAGTGPSLPPLLSSVHPTFFPTPVPTLPPTPPPAPLPASQNTLPVFVSLDTTLPVESTTPTSTLAASPTPSTVSISREEPRTVSRLVSQSRQPKALSAGTAVPVRELPRNQQPEQPTFPFQSTANRFGFTPLQFPQGSNPLFARPNQFLQGRQPAPAFLRNPQSQPPTSGTPLEFFPQFSSGPSSMPSFGSNVFLRPPQSMGPMSHIPPLNLSPAFQRFPSSQSFPQVPKQFRPIAMPKPTLETRHLPEPRVISTNRPPVRVVSSHKNTENRPQTETRHLAEPRVISTSRPRVTPTLQTTENISPTEAPRSRTSQSQLLSFTALKELQAVSSTTPKMSTTTTTTTTTSRTTTQKLLSSPSSPISTEPSTPSFKMFAATMRPIRPTQAAVPQFVRFPTRRPEVLTNNKNPLLHHLAPLPPISPQTNQIQPSTINNGNNPHLQTSLFAPIKPGSSVPPPSAFTQTNFRQNPFHFAGAGPGRFSEAESLSMSDVTVPTAQSNIPASHVNQLVHPNQLHVFTPSQPADRTPPVFRATPGPAQSPSSLADKKPQEATLLANDILSTLTDDQLQVLRQQLAVSLFPGNNIQENFRFNSPTPAPAKTTTTTQTTSTTKRPLNFRLKSRERLIHRNRARARNPNKIRLTTTARPRSDPEKPSLFDPFTKNSNEVNNVNSNLKISQSFATHPQSVTSFSQEKLNAFANLLAVVNDDAETTTIKSAIGSVSMGEGGFVSRGFENSIETVTSNGLNQFEFFTPKSNLDGSGLSPTMIPAFDDNFDMKNFLRMSSTEAPRVLMSSSGAPPTVVPVTQSRLPPSTPPFFSSQETISPFLTTLMDFQPTEQTPTVKDEPKIFNFQPTPTGRKQRFKPTTPPRQFEFPTEAFQSNEIGDFAPKFFVDPLMKEKFAIVKVKNHNFVEKPKPTTIPTEEPEIVTTTTKAPTSPGRGNLVTKGGLRKKLNRKSTGRRRVVKRIKGPRKLKSPSKSGQNPRKRLPLIRRKSTATLLKTTATTTTTTTTTTSSTTTTTTTSTTERENILNSGKIPESRGLSVSDKPSPAVTEASDVTQSPAEEEKSEDASARVLELTNNILELKAKLEKLKMELRI